MPSLLPRWLPSAFVESEASKSLCSHFPKVITIFVISHLLKSLTLSTSKLLGDTVKAGCRTRDCCIFLFPVVSLGTAVNLFLVDALSLCHVLLAFPEAMNPQVAMGLEVESPMHHAISYSDLFHVLFMRFVLSHGMQAICSTRAHLHPNAMCVFFPEAPCYSDLYISRTYIHTHIGNT